ncbi:MAG TPA: type VII secretion protein EccCb [Pseudonocardia sp.]|nr:type VII secretion protein EccCb [Pseudonocardia sp.]
MTATDALEYAFEGEHRYFERPVHRSMFTSMVIEALQTGAADVDRNGMITADELYDYVYRKMQPRGIQTPTRYARTEGSFTVAKTRPTTVSLTTAAKPPPVTLDHLLPAPDEAPRELQPPVGRSAEPAGNAAIVQFDLTGQGGHVVVVGQIHSGKSTLVQTLVVGLSLTHAPGNAAFYCIDSGGQLAALARLPHVKMVIDPEEHRRRAAMLAKISEIMAERKKLFRRYRIPSAEAFRARRKDGSFPAGDHADVFLIIDGWAQTSDVDGTLAETVRRIASDGLRFGVHVVVTARSWREVPPRLADLMLGRIELRLSDPRESRIDPALAATLPKHSGYGLHEAGRFVIAQPEVDASSGYDLDQLMVPEDAAGDDHWLADDDTEEVLPGESLSVSLSLLALLGLRGAAGTFDLRQAWAPRPVRDRYRIPFGVDEHGRPVELDIKEAAAGGVGPHGICVGATGSGKSELLRTIVLGMMVRHSSSTLNFVLVDFKGGATFLGLDKAPHVAATITNLAGDLKLVDRMKDAIAGEVARRQEELAKGNYKNVWDYEKARENGADLDPMPALFIVVDEISELLTAKPDFIDIFLQIGRVGRSLQMHMLLASQRLEEGKLRGLDTFLSYRIGLKTFSAAESRAAIGVPDAFELPPIPGSGYLGTQGGGLIRFKAAYVSGPYRPAGMKPAGPVANVVRADKRPQLFVPDFVELPPEPEPVVAPVEEAPKPDEGNEPSELEVMVDRFIGQGPPAHEVWLPPLREPNSLDTLLPNLNPTEDRGLSPVGFFGNGKLQVPVGIVDRPFEQRRDPLWVDFSGAAGHGVVVGGTQSGKSTLLRTLIMSMALANTPEEAQFYCVDLGGGTLAGLAGLPHVGGVAVARREPDKARRIVAELTVLANAREALYGELGIDSIADFRNRKRRGEITPEQDPYGDAFLIVDGWRALRDDFEELEPQITALAQRGLAYGVHVIVSATRWADIRPAIKDVLGTRLELRLGDPSESDIDRRTAINVPEGRPGRGLTRERLHMLTGLPRIDGVGDPETVGAGVADAVAKIRAAWTGRAAPQVRLLPEVVTYDEVLALDKQRHTRLVPIGINEDELSPVYLDFDADPHFMAFADGESGKTNLLRQIVRGITERYSAKEGVVVLVDYRRTMLGVVQEPHLLGYAVSANQLDGMIKDIAGSMTRRLPGPDVTQEQLRNRSWWKGPELFVVVDDYDLVVTQTNNPLKPLSEFLAQAKDVGLHMIVARRTGGAARAAYDPIIGKLKEIAAPGIVMNGSKDEGNLLGTVKPGPMPPGRGNLVSRKVSKQLMQVSWIQPE